MGTETRLDRLEEALISLAESEKRLHGELLEFKEEMRRQREEDRRKFDEFKEEMRKQREEDRRRFDEFKEEMRRQREEDRRRFDEFKEEMRVQREEDRRRFDEFKEEMRRQREEDRRKFDEFKEEMKNAQRSADERFEKFKDEMNRKWGWLINKLGTLVEDLFYPSFDIAIEKHFKIELERKEMRKYRKKAGKSMEIDVVGVGDGKVFVLEVKATPDKEEYINKFLEKIEKFFEYFPEYEGLDIVPIYGSWSMKKETIERLSELGIYAMIVRGDVLEIVNMNDVK